ncbi:hypothetical protein FRC12_008267 [Ceratobasidium sp. 428]|nr:hypothetical protein FRC12_008267 [Ceratobasidium sp. 428]
MLRSEQPGLIIRDNPVALESLDAPTKSIVGTLEASIRFAEALDIGLDQSSTFGFQATVLGTRRLAGGGGVVIAHSANVCSALDNQTPKCLV